MEKELKAYMSSTHSDLLSGKQCNLQEMMQTAQSNVRRPVNVGMNAQNRNCVYSLNFKTTSHACSKSNIHNKAIAPAAQTHRICYPTYPCQYTQLLYRYCLQIPSLELQRLLLYHWVLKSVSPNRDRGKFPLALRHPISPILY